MFGFTLRLLARMGYSHDHRQNSSGKSLKDASGQRNAAAWRQWRFFSTGFEASGCTLRATFTGTPAEDAIHAAISAYAKPQKIDMLKVLPAPPEATDGGTVDASVASGKPATPAPLPARSYDASSDGDRPQVQTSNAFNRGGDPFPGLSPEGTNKVVGFAFGGKEGEVLDSPVRTTDAFSVVLLKDRKVATREEFEKDRAAVEDELLGLKRDEALSLYVKRLRDQAKDDIKIDEAYVQEARADGGTSGEPEDEDQY